MDLSIALGVQTLRWCTDIYLSQQRRGNQHLTFVNCYNLLEEDIRSIIVLSSNQFESLLLTFGNVRIPGMRTSDLSQIFHCKELT